MGLTDKGFQRRTFDDILNDKIQRAKELFGEDIDVSELSPLGKFIRINAYDQAMAEEEIECVYYARFPNTASGQSLDRLLPFVGITRNPASASVYSVEVHGTAGYVIPAGTLVGTDTGVNFATETEYTIGEDGTCMVNAVCTEGGEVGNLATAGEIVKLVNPSANITSVSGKACVTAGQDEESDADLRMRFAAAAAGTGSCNENAIRAAIMRIPTVQYAAVIANDTDDTDSEGRPPHSFQCYVLGGDDYEQEIADAIFSKRPIGISTVGDKSVTITDVSGTQRTVSYSPAQKIMITVKAAISVSTSFPDDGIARVQKDVADYINGMGIGKSLVLSALYGHIYSVPGVNEVTSLELSTDGGSSYSTGNVAVSAYGVAVCAGVLVEVAG